MHRPGFLLTLRTSFRTLLPAGIDPRPAGLVVLDRPGCCPRPVAGFRDPGAGSRGYKKFSTGRDLEVSETCSPSGRSVFLTRNSSSSICEHVPPIKRLNNSNFQIPFLLIDMDGYRIGLATKRWLEGRHDENRADPSVKCKCPVV